MKTAKVRVTSDIEKLSQCPIIKDRPGGIEGFMQRNGGKEIEIVLSSHSVEVSYGGSTCPSFGWLAFYPDIHGYPESGVCEHMVDVD